MFYCFNRPHLIVVCLYFFELLVDMVVCLAVMKLLRSYKPREDKALCLLLSIPFLSDQFGSVLSNISKSALSKKKSDIIDNDYYKYL